MILQPKDRFTRTQDKTGTFVCSVHTNQRRLLQSHQWDIFTLLWEKRLLFQLYNIFLLKEEKAHYKKMEGNVGLSPCWEWRDWNTPKKTPKCVTHTTWPLYGRSEENASAQIQSCSVHTHSTHTHLLLGSQDSCSQECSAQVQTPPEKRVDSWPFC